MGPSRSNVAVVALAGLELDLQGDVMDAEYFLQHPGQRLADLFGIDLSADEHHVGGQDRLARSQSPCMQVVHSVDIGLRQHLCPYVLHVPTCGNALHEHLAGFAKQRPLPRARKSVVWGKNVSERWMPGCRRIIKKKK